MIYLVSRFQGPSKAVRRHQGRAGGQEKLGLGRSPLKQGEDSGTGLDRGKSGTQSSQGRLQTSVVTSGGLLGMFLQVPVSKPTERCSCGPGVSSGSLIWTKVTGDSGLLDRSESTLS